MVAFKKFREFFDGRKTAIGVILVAAPVALEQGRQFLVALGVDPTKAATWFGTALLAVGLAHKAYKAVVLIEGATTTVTVTTTPAPVPAAAPPAPPTVTVTTTPTPPSAEPSVTVTASPV
jgi:hypothetical protein